MKNSNASIQITGLFLVLLVASVASVGQAVKSPPGEASSSRANKTAAHEQSSRGQYDGIKVHGHWTIVVHNKDGSVASRAEFENSLVSGQVGGGLLLTSVLARQTTIGYWVVQLGGAPTPYQANPSGGVLSLTTQPGACILTQPNTATYFQGCVFPNTLTLTSSGNVPYTMTLTGSAKGTSPITIDSVTLYNAFCLSNTTPQACGADPYGGLLNNTSILLIPFTSTQRTPITVPAGQTVDVTVTISFS